MTPGSSWFHWNWAQSYDFDLWRVWCAAGVKMASILVNSYAFNLYGILEGMISNEPICDGRGLNHYALDNCNSHPLSMRPVYNQVIKVHRQFDQVSAKTIAYIGIIFGLNDGTQRLAYNSFLAFAIGPLAKSSRFLRTLKIGEDTEYLRRISASFQSISSSGVTGIGALVGGFVQAIFASMHGVFYVYDEILLKYVTSLIQNKHYQDKNDAEVAFFALSNLVFDSIALGPMKNVLITPQFRVCQTYSQLTGDTQSAAGKTIFHACAAVVEVFYASLQVVSSTITLAAVSDCICNINEYENEFIDVFEQRCRYKLPEALHPQLMEYIQTRTQQNSVSVCAVLVNNFKNVLLKIPVQSKIHINLALKNAIDVPVQLMNFMKIDGLQADSCTQYETTLDVMTIIPRPISAFKKCAYLPTCRSRCQEEIDHFYGMKLNIARPNVSPINSALMAFLPAWVTQFENLDEQFTPVAVQDYRALENCDHYIVVIGRSLYAARTLEAPFTMYIFCYSDKTTSMVILSKILLPATRHFVLSQGELAVKVQARRTENIQLVSEIFMPPLADTDDRGALVLMVWDNEGPFVDGNNNNAIFEVFVDSMDTVHAAWLMHSRDINSNLVCANLHASIMASCNGAITDVAQYNFINTDSASATFKKIAILPKKQPPQATYDADKRPVAYTIIGLLHTFVEYTSDDDLGAVRNCKVELEFTWMQRRRFASTDSTPACTVHQPVREADNVQNITLFSLFQDRILRNREILLSTSPLDTLLLITTKNYAAQQVQDVQRIEAIVDHTSGTPRLLFAIQRVDKITLDPALVRANQQRFEEYSFLQSNSISAYVGVILHDAYHGLDKTIRARNLIAYTMKQSSIKTNTGSEGFIKEFAFTLSSSADMQAWRDYGKASDAQKSASTELVFEMSAGSGFAKTLDVYIEEKCDYMNCKACSTRRLRASCEAAQKCAMVNCVGTVINPNNVLCVVGSLLKEIYEVYLTNIDAVWFGLVETSMSALKLSKISGSKNVVYLESVSNFVNNALCETKDIYAALSAILPSFVFSIYVAVAGKGQHNTILDIQNPGTSKIRQTFSPGTQLQNVAMVSSITQMIYQVALVHLHISHAASKFMLCMIDKFAELSGGFVDIVNHDTELEKEGGSIDFCMQQSSMPTGLRPKSDQEIINERVAIGAVDNNIVDVKIAGFAVAPGVFTIDIQKAIVWANNFRYVTWLIWTNAAFDSALGMLYGLSRLLGIVENEECKARPVEFSSILKCVCGDTPYTIDSIHRSELASTGALFCTGLLKMINAEGNVVYIENPYSLHQLAQDLHTPGQAYIDCIAVNSEQSCATQRSAVFLPKFAGFFTVHQVSPLAVLARCRENYNSKTWDEGVFGLYDPVLQEDITKKQRHTTKARLVRIRDQVDLYLQETDSGIVHQCLAAGPLKNRIQACMTLTFTHLNHLQATKQAAFDAVAQEAPMPIAVELSAVAYFTYDAAPGSMYPDACEYLSSPSFLQNPDVRKCRNEDAEDISTGNACGFSVSDRADACTIGQSTLAFEQSIQTNIIDEFRISNGMPYDKAKIDAVDARVQARYQAVSTCTSTYTTNVDQEIMANIRKIVDALDLTLTTGEGDLLHQFVDCIFMGAQLKTVLAPADTGGIMENLMYSRHANGSSRAFELPCVGTHVYDRSEGADSKPFLQKTCGSDTRIAVMAYVTRTIIDTDNGGLHALVASLITEKIQSIVASITDVGNYGCLGKVTGLAWHRSSSVPTDAGQLLKNTPLSEMLSETSAALVTLTAVQWKKTGISDLRRNDYIQAGSSYFHPKLDVSWKYCCAQPGECKAGESNFESNLPNVDTTISVDTVLSGLVENVRNIEQDAIMKNTVSLRVWENTGFCDTLQHITLLFLHINLLFIFAVFLLSEQSIQKFQCL